MLDGSAGWGWGQTLVAHTADGAATLVDVTPTGIDSAHRVISQSFLDSQHAWVVAGPVSRTGDLTLYRTSDAGADWAATALDLDATFDARPTFMDAQHGWLEASRLGPDHLTMQIRLLRTTDGGGTWSAVYQTGQRITVEPAVQQGDCQWSSLVFSSAQVGFAGLGCNSDGAPQLDMTRDGGRSWSRMQLPQVQAPTPGTLMSTSVTPLTFVSAQDGLAAVSQCIGDGTTCYFHSGLYRTSDGGVSWSSQPATEVTSGAVMAADLDHAWAPAVGGLEATDDGGRTWTSLPLPSALAPSLANSVSYQFLSPTIGYAVSLLGRMGPTVTHFYRTTDGGGHFGEFTPTLEYASTSDLPRGGLTFAGAIAAAEREGRNLSAAVSVESLEAGHVEEFGSLSGSPPTRWVWSVVLRGTFGPPSCGALPFPGSHAACTPPPPATSARLILDYFTGAFLVASIPAPLGG